MLNNKFILSGGPFQNIVSRSLYFDNISLFCQFAAVPKLLKLFQLVICNLFILFIKMSALGRQGRNILWIRFIFDISSSLVLLFKELLGSCDILATVREIVLQIIIVWFRWAYILLRLLFWWHLLILISISARLYPLKLTRLMAFQEIKFISWILRLNKYSFWIIVANWTIIHFVAIFSVRKKERIGACFHFQLMMV